MSYRWTLFFASIVVAPLLAMPAAAESPIDKEAALDASFEALLDNAQSAFNDGDFQAAIEYQIVAERTDSDPRLLLNIARSYEELGDCRRELAYYEAFLDNPTDDDSLIERAQSALDEKAPECDDYHDQLGGRLFFESHPQLATVFIDDEPIGVTPTETIALEPGSYTVRIELDDYSAYTTEIDITPDEERINVRADLQEVLDEPSEDDAAVAEDDSVDEPPAVDESTFRPDPIALGLLGTGAAAALTGGILDLWMIPRVDQRRDQALAEGDNNRVDELTSDRQNYAIGAVAGYVVGAVVGVGGAAWLGYDYYHHINDDADENPLSWHLTPRIDHRGAGLWMHGRF